MAITDNVFTAEEFKGALTANRDALIPVIKTVLGTDLKMVVQDEAEHAAFRTQHESEVAGKLTEKWATNVETDLKEITGIPRVNGDEKWHAYMKRVAAALKKERDEMDAELTRLKANGNPSAADKARIKELEEGITKEKNDSKTLKETYEKQLRNLTAGNKIEVAIGEIRPTYKKDIDPDLVQTKEAVVRQKLLDMAQVGEDGAVTFIGPDGKVMSDPATLLPRSEKSLLTEYLKPLIDTGRQQTGAGSGQQSQGQQGGGAGGNGAPVLDALPSGVNTKIGLTKHMLSMGFIRGSKEFNETHNKLGANLPLGQ